MSGIAIIDAQGAAKPLRVFFRDNDIIKYLYWNIRRENDGSITEYSQIESLAEGAAGNSTAMYTPDSRMEHVFFSDAKGNIVHIVISTGIFGFMNPNILGNDSAPARRVYAKSAFAG